LKVREVIRILEKDGWQWRRTRGSHHQFRHTKKSGKVTVPGKPGDDMRPATFNSIMKQAGLK